MSGSIEYWDFIMSDWPPQPKPTPEQKNTTSSPQSSGREWDLLEKALLASTREQTRTRRWNIFFKLLTFAYLFFILISMTKSCSMSGAETPSLSKEHLAVIDIVGVIDSESRQGVSSENTNKALQKAFKATGSKAVVLNINSPGGSPVQSDEIWQEIRQLKLQYPDKKVYAVIGDTGASGAYYIASAADEILVNPSSLVGSIGVIMPNYGVHGLLEKWGITDRTMIAGENKALLSMTKPINEEQRKHIQALLDNVHSHFIAAVKEGRGQRLKDKPEIFSGLIWTGDQAIDLGVVDREGSLSSLKKELKLKEHINYTIPNNSLEQFLGKIGVSLGQGFGASISQSLQSQQHTQVR